MPVSFLSPLSGSCLPSLPSRLSKGKRLCFSTRVPLYICTQLIKYFHFAPFPSGNRCLTAKLFCLTRAATDYTCWLQTRGLFFPLFFLFENHIPLKKKKSLSLHCHGKLCLLPRIPRSGPGVRSAGGIRPPRAMHLSGLCVWIVFLTLI